MSKIRIYELAKELSSEGNKLTSKELIEKAKELGIPAETHLSQLDEIEAARLKKAMIQQMGQRNSVGEVRVRRTVVRRRVRTVEPAGEGSEAVSEIIEETVEERPIGPTVIRRRVAAPPEPVQPETPPKREEPKEPEVPLEVGEEQVAAQSAEMQPAVASVEVESPAAEAEAEAVEHFGVLETEAAGSTEVAAVQQEEQAEAEQQPVPAAVEGLKPKPTPHRKKDAVKAVVVSMPEVVEEAQPTPLPRLSLRPRAWMIEADEKFDAPRRKGKRLIYDRRKEAQFALGMGDRDSMRGGKVRRKKPSRKKEESELPPAPPVKRVIEVQETITVGELAQQMAVKSSLLLRKLVEQGIMANVNDALDFETAAIIAQDLGYEVENVAFDLSKYLQVEPDNPENLEPRPPVVTIMGHVDHGKTSLLDRIQKSDIVAGEAGGITQRIGAYVVKTPKGRITFIDTPGHEAFTAMRARGAQVTDIVVLVVAADDGVMPQTLEAINHARAAGVPIVVAVNKIDKPEADPQRVRRELSTHELVAEEWGGTTIFVDVSARTGEGVDTLLEMILLQAEVLELKADPKKRATGIIIESRLDKGRGPVASIIVKSGTLKPGDIVVTGGANGKVRALVDPRGRQVREVRPGEPAEIIGLDKVPPAGEWLYVVLDEKTAKLIAYHREKKAREEKLARVKKPTLEQLMGSMSEEEVKTVKVVLKADTQGAVDAIRQGIEQLSTETKKVNLEVIHEGVGAVSESDVNLASTSDGIILGFNVRPDPKARALADSQGVEILTFSLIHDLLDRIRLLMEGKLEMVEQEVLVGRAEVKQVFSVGKVGKVAGCYVLDGKVMRSCLIRVLRGGDVLFRGRLSSLKRFKEDVREVSQGFECGLGIQDFDDFREGDLIEAFEITKTAATL